MSDAFYKYIANSIINYFDNEKESIFAGERFCLRLDNKDMVLEVYKAICNTSKERDIQGVYIYDENYSTITIKLSSEIVIAAKYYDKNSMTDDFLGTLRNASRSNENPFPILMITDSTIETVSSGTIDFSANGMPFHSETIKHKVKKRIEEAEGLRPWEKEVLKFELKRKQQDKFSDKTSLYEYANFITILDRGKIEDEDWSSFCLVVDKDIDSNNEKNITNELEANHILFEKINNVYKYGNISEELCSEFEDVFITDLEKKKKEDKEVWWCNYNEDGSTKSYITYQFLRSKEKGKEKDPLIIEDENINILSEDDYVFNRNVSFFVKAKGEKAAEKRIKSILIFKEDKNREIQIEISTNRKVKVEVKDNVEIIPSSYKNKNKVRILNSHSGCNFANLEIEKYKFNICVLNISPSYLENFQTCYNIITPKKGKDYYIQVTSEEDSLIVKPNESNYSDVDLKPEKEISISSSSSTRINIDDNEINYENGDVLFYLRIEDIKIPFGLHRDKKRATEITGIKAFLEKFKNKQSFQFRKNEKIVLGTNEYFAKSDLLELLKIENSFVKEKFLCAFKNDKDIEKIDLCINEEVRTTYFLLLEEYAKLKTVPSLAYYNEGESLSEAAKKYLQAVFNFFEKIQNQEYLTEEDSNTLYIGSLCEEVNGEKIIKMSPLHPLNIMYQMELVKENNVAKITQNIANKLTPLYLLPYITDQNENIYQAIEQKFSLEWRFYASLTNKRFMGSRAFVQKVVTEKIKQFQDNFSFLFDGMGNKIMKINLVNMGDCKEVLIGLINYYKKYFDSEQDWFEEVLNFEINIYSDNDTLNCFSLLANSKLLREFITDNIQKLDISEISDFVTVICSRVKVFYKNINGNDFKYAHLTFYEMESSNKQSTNNMNSISTGALLNGFLSSTSSALVEKEHKTGFGLKYAEKESSLIKMSKLFNSAFAVANTTSPYNKDVAIFTSIKNDQLLLEKIYNASNWVVFISPKVDLSFFSSSNAGSLMILHYSDQYTTTNGFDDITVTNKTEQYNSIIRDEMNKKYNISLDELSINNIISFFNAINGSWLLRLISNNSGNNQFSREKISILSAIKFCLVYYEHPNIRWIPVSLEEMLRVGRGAGWSQREGLLSAKNLGFENGPTCDDIILVGIEKKDKINVYLHPVEVKIGTNDDQYLKKAREQALDTYNGFMKAFWKESARDDLNSKMYRNFFMQFVVSSYEKLKMYGFFDSSDDITDMLRANLLCDNFVISKDIEDYIGIGTVISFKKDCNDNMVYDYEDGIYTLTFPLKKGYRYMADGSESIEEDLRQDKGSLPKRLKEAYKADCASDSHSMIQKTYISPYSQFVDAADVSPTKYDRSEQKKCDKACSKEVDKTTYDGKESDAKEISNCTMEQDENDDDNSNLPQKGMKILFGIDTKEGAPVFWEPNNTEQLFHTNTGIIGTMGTGKTQFTKSVITQLYRERNNNISDSDLGILIFDYKGDYNRSKEDFVDATEAQIFNLHKLPFNPFALIKPNSYKPLLPYHIANAFVDTISKIYHLGVKQEKNLLDSIMNAYNVCGILSEDENTWDNIPPTFETVYECYDNNTDIKKEDSLASAMSKLYSFRIFEGNPEKTKSLFDVLKGVVVIDLSNYDPNIQNLIVAIILDLFYAQMKASGTSKMDGNFRQLTKLILVDEADNFMNLNIPSFKKILKEGREFGVGTILSTQFLKHFITANDDYESYILTWVVHNVSDLKTSEVEKIFNTNSRDPKTKNLPNEIRQLKKHYSLVKIGNDDIRMIRDKAFWELMKESKNLSQQ